MLNETEIRARATEEVERALRYRRPLSFLLVDCDRRSREMQAHLTRTAGCLVRTPDIVGRIGPFSLLFIFPETGETARIPAKRVLSQVCGIDGSARGVLVRCPNNGMNTEALLSAARGVLKDARAGSLSELPDKVEHLDFGPRAPRVIAADEKMKRLFVLIGNLAKSDLPILILGETGVGKEGAAAAVHHGSRYCDGPFVAINCAAMPSNLLESELFGYEKGAFSGAVTAKPGLVETANGGTLFLDEVTDASPETQAKLLRVLETKRNRRVGAVHETPVHLRLVSAASRRLDAMLEEDGFRKDLYYRIGGARIEIPPLRDRPIDILPLAAAFLTDAIQVEGRAPMALSDNAAKLLQSYSWPGNVRELKHAMAYLAAVVQDAVIEPHDLAAVMSKTETMDQPRIAPIDGAPEGFQKLSDEIASLEKRRMAEALMAVGGARARAASLLGMPLRTFVAKLKRYHLTEVGRADACRGRG